MYSGVGIVPLPVCTGPRRIARIKAPSGNVSKDPNAKQMNSENSVHRAYTQRGGRYFGRVLLGAFTIVRARLGEW